MVSAQVLVAYRAHNILDSRDRVRCRVLVQRKSDELGACVLGRRTRVSRTQDLTPWLSHKIFTARAASSTNTVNEMIDWSIIRTLPQRASTGTSVGEKAVLVLNEMKR